MNDEDPGETEKQNVKTGGHTKAEKDPGWTDGENDEDAEDWEWEVPELGPGSP
jgi:hypothetical protein